MVMNKLKLLAIGSMLCVAVSVLAQGQQVRVFSHRGGRMEHDENTMEAFLASYNNGYRGFETDVRMTSDGQLVIMHDNSLDRTTNGTGNVEDKTLAQLRELRTKQGNPIVTLDELLDFLKDKENLYVEFEMKTKPTRLYPQKRLEKYCDLLYEKVMAAKPADADYVFTSSDLRGLKYLKKKHPDVDLLMITTTPCNDAAIKKCKNLGIKRLGAQLNGTSREDIQKAHKAGLAVSLWPGQSFDDFVLGTYLGADYLCTDIPIEVKNRATETMPWVDAVY